MSLEGRRLTALRNHRKLQEAAILAQNHAPRPVTAALFAREQEAWDEYLEADHAAGVERYGR